VNKTERLRNRSHESGLLWSGLARTHEACPGALCLSCPVLAGRRGASIKERCNAVLRIIPQGIYAAAPNNTISYAIVATREGVKHYVKIYIQLRAVDHSARGSMKNAAKREN
jgi:hypothetical protein